MHPLTRVFVLGLTLAACADAGLGEDLPRSHATLALARDGEVLQWRQVALMPQQLAPQLTYDSSRARVVSIGATSADVETLTVLESDGASWFNALSFQQPGPRRRFDFSLAFDARRQRTVLFGGSGAEGVLDDLWEWNGSAWTERTRDASWPERRFAHVTAYTAEPSAVVMFGGSKTAVGGQRLTDETWLWDGVRWTMMDPAAAPSARANATAAYDPTRRRLVLFGGESSTRLGDTWEWDGVTWERRATTGPSARSAAAMAFDPHTSSILLWGGLAAAEAEADALWSWNGTRWTKLTQTTPVPTARLFPRMAYDTARDRLVLSGGVVGNSALQDTWTWDGQTWSDRSQGLDASYIPTDRGDVAMAYDSARGTTVLFGGRTVTAVGVPSSYAILGDTWTWNGIRWTQQAPTSAPSARFGMSMVYDQARNETVLFGGHTGSATSQETWVWNGTEWQARASGPYPAHFASLAYDSTRQQVVLFGGVGDSGVVNAHTWLWNGASWSENLAEPKPEPRFGAATVFDPARGTVLLFGGRGAVTYDDTWEWDGQRWTRLSEHAVLPRTNAATSYDAARAQVVLFGGRDDGSYYGDTWEWNAAWTQRAPTSSPLSRYAHAMTYDAGRSRLLLFGGMAGQTAGVTFADTYELASRGASCSSNADSTTGFCVDGVSCESQQCAACETCNAPGDRGRCSTIFSNEDPDSCSTAAHGSICDALGACKAVLGSAASTAADCASGYLVDGVCCEVPGCAPCLSCNAADHETLDNGGRCAAQRAGLDRNEQCAAQETSTCGTDGTCDGRGACRLHPAGVSCGDDGAEARQCSGTGECRVVSSYCEDQGTLRLPNGERASCGAYACVDNACVSQCASIGDCAPGAICTQSGECIPGNADPVASEGCDCRAAPGSAPFSSKTLWLAAAILTLACRRRAARRLTLGVACLALGGCSQADPAPRQTTTSALETGSVVRWRQLGDSPVSYAGALAYDGVRGRSVWLGTTSVESPTTTWDWDGETWRSTPASTLPQLSPDSRGLVGMTYDSDHKEIVMFGGLVGTGSLANDTWIWNGAHWQQRVTDPLHTPRRRESASLAYDSDRKRVVMAHGRGGSANDGYVFFDEIWEWDGQSWEQRPTSETRPSARAYAAMVYDKARHRMVSVGGRDGSGAFLADTWEWNGETATWTRVDEASIGARAAPTAAYDEVRQRTVLFGGAVGSALRDLYEWDGTSWTLRSTEGPPGRQFPTSVYDPLRQRYVLFLGIDAVGQQPETWEWDGVTWHDRTWRPMPAGRSGAATGYDPKRGAFVMFGGTVAYADGVPTLSDETWLWDGGPWRRHEQLDGPSARSEAATAYDEQRETLLMVGGRTAAATATNERWLWKDGTWSRQTTSGPSARRGAGLAYDQARGNVLLFGGASGSVQDDTWTWNGSAWARLRPAHSPPSRVHPALVYDRAREKILLFGGTGAQGTILGDTWEWDGSDWTEHPGDGPSPRRGASMAYDPRRAVVVLFGGGINGSTLSDSWEWDGTSWRFARSTEAPRGRVGHTVAYDAAHQRIVTFGGEGNSTTFYDDAWELTARGGTCSSDLDSATGHCVDGVSCEQAACGECAACNTPRDPGRCSGVINADDDTCNAETHGKSCDATSRCKLALGSVTTDPNDCASGWLTDGVCCESASCGTCATCNLAEKELAEANGRCGAQKAGTDKREECNGSEPTSCGQTGACDGQRRCQMFGPDTACGEDFEQDGKWISRTCSGSGACLNVEASCDGQHTVVAASGARVDCTPYACAGAACNARCQSITDCAPGFVCTGDGACSPPSEATSEDSGCACRTGPTPAPRFGPLLALALLAARRRRR